VLDAGSKSTPGGFKYYGKKMTKDLKQKTGDAVIEAHWHQRHDIDAV
jgi:hypothetical protein